MDTIKEHNRALQQFGFFSASDLEWNRQKRYSPSQLKRFENEQFIKQHRAVIAEQRGSPSLMILTVGLILFAMAADYNGSLSLIKLVMGDLFLPGMLVALVLALFFILVVIPHLYAEPGDFYRTADALPAGTIRVIEAPARVRSLELHVPGFPRVTHLLEMDGVKFQIPERLSRVIQPERCYRVYAVHSHGEWILLSMEMCDA